MTSYLDVVDANSQKQAPHKDPEEGNGAILPGSTKVHNAVEKVLKEEDFNVDLSGFSSECIRVLAETHHIKQKKDGSLVGAKKTPAEIQASSKPTDKATPKKNTGEMQEGQVYEGNLTFKEYQSLGYLPQLVIGNLDFDDCIDPTGVIFPKTVNGNVSLKELTSASGLVLPEEINGHLFLSGLVSEKDLILPKQVKWGIFLAGLPTKELKKLKRRYVLKKRLDCSYSLKGQRSTLGRYLKYIVPDEKESFI